MGDATNLVLIFAGELLKKAEYLITMGLHPSEILQGYEIARDKCLAELEQLSFATLSTPPTPQSLALALKPCLASKQYGNEDLLAPLVAEAVSMVLPQNAKNGLADFSVDNVRVVKIMGGSLSQSKVVRGMVFGREPEGVIKKAKAAKVGVYTCGMDITQTETKGTVLLNNADELSSFARGEEQQLEKYFKEIADSGVTVVVTQSQVGELAQHYLNRLASSSSRSSPNSSCVVSVVCWVPHPWHDWELLCPKKRDGSIRSRPPRLVAIASPCSSRRTVSPAHSIKKFGEALEVIPRTLAENAGLDATETVSRLYAKHVDSAGADVGVDIENETDGTVPTTANQVLDVLAAKSWALRYATGAAISVLSVDSIIMSKPAGIKAPKANPNWDDD
ncbi:hypothetical protein L1887_47047 [Cichorium endivia]|nr:hypothetical protein L1887_47047 [Cichorium endivia]